MEIVEEFKRRGLLPQNVNVRSFKDAIGILKWNSKEVADVLANLVLTF